MTAIVTAIDSADVNSLSARDQAAKTSRQRISAPGPALISRRSRYRKLPLFDSQAAAKSAIVRAVEQVAKHLGNTAAVCRKCYIHPAIFEGYLDGTLVQVLADRTKAYLTQNVEGMSAEEAAVAAFLRLRLTTLATDTPATGNSRPNLKPDIGADGDRALSTRKGSSRHGEPGPRKVRRILSVLAEGS